MHRSEQAVLHGLCARFSSLEGDDVPTPMARGKLHRGTGIVGIQKLVSPLLCGDLGGHEPLEPAPACIGERAGGGAAAAAAGRDIWRRWYPRTLFHTCTPW
mmetsp:Transcript_7559/g.18463  ORF Transcript_7559/g.18463 Transcript_7559/m.18463 type:complete len:101 (+) Transcript_7559:265-567(+)